MKTFKFEFVKLSLIWRCTNGPRREKDKFDLNFPAGRPQGKINQIIFLLFWAAKAKGWWVDWWLLICCGLRAGGPATAPQQWRQAQSTNQPPLSFVFDWRNLLMKSKRQMEWLRNLIHEINCLSFLIWWGLWAGWPAKGSAKERKQKKDNWWNE